MSGLMDVLTVKEAGKRLRISDRVCWGIIREGRLAATYVTAHTVRITEKSLHEFLLNNTSTTGAPELSIVPGDEPSELDDDVIPLIGDANAA